MKLEVVVIPVSDVDRAKEFYGRLGWRLDRTPPSVVQFTPLLQEVTARLPGRIEAAATSFGSASDLASAMRRAAAAHGEHEKRIGEADPNWPDWYAEYMVSEQAGAEPPK